MSTQQNARIFKSTTRISCTSVVFSLTTKTLAQILISPVHSNVKTISCVQKLVIRMLCASLAYKERVIRVHSIVEGATLPGMGSSIIGMQLLGWVFLMVVLEPQFVHLDGHRCFLKDTSHNYEGTANPMYTFSL